MAMTLTNLSNADIAEARHRFPRVFAMSAVERARRIAAWVIVGAALTLCVWRVGGPTSGTVWEGLGRLGWLLEFLFPPSAGGSTGDFAYAMLESLAMAFLGTLMATILAVPLGFLAARNVMRNWLWHFSIRRLLDSARGIDALIWALVFVSAVGLGPFAGVMAIMMSESGLLAKLFSEAIENIDRAQLDGVKATGARNLQQIRFGILPQVLPIMLGLSLYIFESSTRSATVLGVVGAGGIGMQLTDRVRINQWNQVCFIIILILAAIGVIDFFSRKIRRRFIGETQLRP